MGFGAIQFGGLASGLNTSSIIQAILGIESRPIQHLEDRKQTEQERISLLGTFEGLVRDLQAKAQGLLQGNGFLAYAISVGTEGVAAFTLSDGAQPGGHDLTVDALASADRWTWDGVVDPDAALGSGTIDFTYGATSYSISIAAGSDSLNGIASAINTQAGDDVTATVVNVATAANPSYKLVLAGDDTGADFAIQGLTVTGSALTGQTNLTTASNAQVTIDGLTVVRSTNVFSDVLPGLSFTVSAQGSTTFTIDSDLDGIRANAQSLVDAYNAVVDFINSQSSYDLEAGPSGELFGDAALTTVREAIERALFDVDIATVQNDPLGYSTLSLVGVQIDVEGRLSIDQTTFDAKLSANLEELANLFLDSTDGVLTKLDQELEGLLEATPAVDPITMQPIVNPVTGEQIIVEGLFDRRRNTINAVIGDIDDQVERLEYRLERLEESLVARFANLEQVISGLNAQLAFLAGGVFAPPQ